MLGIIPKQAASSPEKKSGSETAKDSKEQNVTGTDDEDDRQSSLRDRAVAITQVIAQLETGGTLDCNKKGLSGERGCHQFLPSTWALYSQDVFGYVAEQTPENAEHVTYEKVYRWLKQGLTDREIFLIWNQGNPGKCHAGTNKHGVKYDSCDYADTGLAMLNEVIHIYP